MPVYRFPNLIAKRDGSSARAGLASLTDALSPPDPYELAKAQALGLRAGYDVARTGQVNMDVAARQAAMEAAQNLDLGGIFSAAMGSDSPQNYYGAIPLGAALGGAGYDTLDRLNVGNGMDFGNTRTGFMQSDATARRGQDVDMAQALAVQRLKGSQAANAYQNEQIMAQRPMRNYPEPMTRAEAMASGSTIYGADLTPEESAYFSLSPEDQRAKMLGTSDKTIQFATPDGMPHVGLMSEGFPQGAQPILSETQRAGLPGAENPAGPWDSRSENIQYAKIIDHVTQKVRAGQPVSEDEFAQASIAWSRLYGPKSQLISTPQGTRTVDITPPIPPGVFNPITRQWTSAQAPTVGDTMPAPQPSTSVAGPGSTTTVGEAIPGTAPRNSRTEAEARNEQYTVRMDSGADALYSLLGFDPASGNLDPNAYRPGFLDQLAFDYAPNALRGYLLDPEAELFLSTSQQVLNPLLRADSGAAVPEGEYPRYYAQYIPLPGESDTTALAKLTHLQITIDAFREVSGMLDRDIANVEDPAEREHIRQLMQRKKAEIAARRNIDWPKLLEMAKAPAPPRTTYQSPTAEDEALFESVDRMLGIGKGSN